MLYNSDRSFQIWTYGAGHSICILRSPNNSVNEEEGFNIDIEFWGVAYMEITTQLKGVMIAEIKDNNSGRYKFYQTTSGNKVFEIISKEQKFNVVAAGCWIGKNNWYEKNRVLDPTLEYDELIASWT